MAKQMESFKKGFSEVMPVNLLYNFDAQELEFLTAGTLEIDVDDWRAHTEYRNGMSEKTDFHTSCFARFGSASLIIACTTQEWRPCSIIVLLLVLGN